MRDVSALPEHPPVIAVTGLAFEARMAKGPGVSVVCGGGICRRTAAAIEEAVTGGASGIISFGTAGGLVPHLRPGDWVVADGVVAEGQRWPSDPAWLARLLKQMPGATRGAIASVDMPVASASAKEELQARTGAVAVDMESHVAARLALVHGLPFAAFRVIVDSAERSLPPAALAAMRPDGGVNIGAVLASLARQPGQLPQLIRLARDARAARTALFRGSRLLGPGFGCPRFGVPDLVEL
jgi:adenosylhomocysteine nucleosidase